MWISERIPVHWPLAQRGGQQGFTLLEMMAAVAIIAIAVVTLMGSQSRSVATATISRFNITASLLARQKLAELDREDFNSLNSAEGSFAEPFAAYTWQLEVVDLGEEETGIAGGDELLKALDLTISMGEETHFSYSIRAIVMRTPESAGT